MPEHVLEFQASDNWVKAKVMNLSEAEVAGTKNAEEGNVCNGNELIDSRAC